MLKGQRGKRPLVCVFAHPDDEAFGPSGTIAKFAQDRDVYILCATNGEAGGNHKNIAQIRRNELLKSAKILGVKKVYFLNFIDGTLSNSLYHQLASKIETKLKILKPDSLLTFEPRGISGHIDHITVSMVTSYVFQRLSFVRKLLYFCITSENRKLIGDYFIYFPPGYNKDQIDEIIDIKDVWPQKLKAMMIHQSQVSDAKRIVAILKKLPRVEYFQVLEK